MDRVFVFPVPAGDKSSILFVKSSATAFCLALSWIVTGIKYDLLAYFFE
jgi:hypothetical protein